MSSDRPNDARSPEADQPPPPTSSAGPPVTRSRGAALLDALERHLPGLARSRRRRPRLRLRRGGRAGLERERAEAVREAARLHEVGMVYVPRRVACEAAGRADTSQEQGAARLARSQAGAELARGAGIPEQACEWIGAHSGALRRQRARGPAPGADPDRVADRARCLRLRRDRGRTGEGAARRLGACAPAGGRRRAPAHRRHRARRAR